MGPLRVGQQWMAVKQPGNTPKGRPSYLANGEAGFWFILYWPGPLMDLPAGGRPSRRKTPNLNWDTAHGQHVVHFKINAQHTSFELKTRSLLEKHGYNQTVKSCAQGRWHLFDYRKREKNKKKDNCSCQSEIKQEGFQLLSSDPSYARERYTLPKRWKRGTLLKGAKWILKFVSICPSRFLSGPPIYATSSARKLQLIKHLQCILCNGRQRHRRPHLPGGKVQMLRARESRAP